MKNYLVVIKVGEQENKSIWGLLKAEGFIYVGNRTMVKGKRATTTAIEKYKQYLSDLLIDYDNISIKIIEL